MTAWLHSWGLQTNLRPHPPPPISEAGFPLLHLCAFHRSINEAAAECGDERICKRLAAAGASADAIRASSRMLLPQRRSQVSAWLAQPVFPHWTCIHSVGRSLCVAALSRRVDPVRGDLTSHGFICFHPRYLTGSLHQGEQSSPFPAPCDHI